MNPRNTAGLSTPANRNVTMSDLATIALLLTRAMIISALIVATAIMVGAGLIGYGW